MKWILSRYNQDVSYLKDYTDDYVLYDRSDTPLPEAIIVPNIGSDLYDKFTYIIDNYDNLPPVALYTKANIFKYISKDELEKIKDNTTFTPILSQMHETKIVDLEATRSFLVNMVEKVDIEQDIKDLWYQFNQTSKDKVAEEKRFCFYEDGMFYEINIPYYYGIYQGNEKENLLKMKEIQELMGFFGKEYVPFAPGSNYILPKENILKHPRSMYVKLRNYLAYGLHNANHYPREAYLIERGLYTLWHIPQSQKTN